MLHSAHETGLCGNLQVTHVTKHTVITLPGMSPTFPNNTDNTGFHIQMNTLYTTYITVSFCTIITINMLFMFHLIKNNIKHLLTRR